MRTRPVVTTLLALFAQTAASGQALSFEIPAAGHLAPLADLDGDGVDELRIDFDVYSGADGSWITSTFVPPPGGPFQSAGTPIGDFDGDGYPDVAFLLTDPFSSGVPIQVHSGQTGTLLAQGQPHTYLPGCDTIDWVDGDHDVDGDGVPDLVYGSQTHCFGSTVQGYLSGVGFTQGNPVTQLGDGMLLDSALRAVFDDFDSDGTEDVLFQYFDEYLTPIYYRADAYDADAPPFGIFTLQVYTDTITGTADVDGDGQVDLLGVKKGDAPTELKFVSGATLGMMPSPPGSLFEAAWGVGDLDCDGFDEFLTAGSGGMRIYSGQNSSVVFTNAFHPDRFVQLGDIDGNGLGAWAVGSTALGKTQVWTAPEPPTPTYCTGKVNSQGCVPTVGTFGVPTAQGPDDFFLTARDVLVGKPGLFFWGTIGPTAVPFLGGTLCVQPPLQRGPVLVSTGPADCEAGYLLHFSHALAEQFGVAPGSVVNGQFWMRDPANADGTGVALSNAVEFPWCE